MYNVIKAFTADETLSSADMVVVCVLSHGHDGIIVSADGLEISIEKDILRKFNNEYCPALYKKPKLFLFQACRGDNLERGVAVDSPDSHPVHALQSTDTSTAEDANMMKEKRRTKSFLDVSTSDMLIVYATLPGYVALRDTVDGTYFVQSICKIFAESAKDTELSDLIAMVGDDLRRGTWNGLKEVCTYENRLFKKLYFNPGIYLQHQQEQEQELQQEQQQYQVKGGTS